VPAYPGCPGKKAVKRMCVCYKNAIVIWTKTGPAWLTVQLELTSTLVGRSDLLVTVWTDTHERADEVLARVTTPVDRRPTLVHV